MEEKDPLIAALEARIDNMTTEVARKLAWIQESRIKHHIVKQTILSKGQPELDGWWPILEYAPSNLVFAPLVESKIEELCATEHTFNLGNGDTVQVSFTRFTGFMEAERILFQDVFRPVRQTIVEDYLPALTFPFLPYSRKFLVPTCKTITDINIAAGTLEHNDQFGDTYPVLKANMYPIWNVEHTVFDIRNAIRWPEVLKGGKYAWPMPNQQYTYISEISDTNGAPIDSPVLEQGNTISTAVKPGKIAYTYIHPSPERYESVYPKTGMRPSTESYFHKYWSGFFAGVELTRSDLTMLLNAIPEIKQRLKIKDVIMTETRLGNSIPSSFRNYSWQQENNVANSNAKSLVELTLDTTQTQLPNYFIESLGDYYAALCSRVFNLSETSWRVGWSHE